MTDSWDALAHDLEDLADRTVQAVERYRRLERGTVQKRWDRDAPPAWDRCVDALDQILRQLAGRWQQ